MESIVNFGNYLNPFNENFLGYQIIEGIIDGFTEFFTGDGTSSNRGVLGFLSSIFNSLASIVNFVIDFFDNLLHLFVPTSEQWTTIKTRFSGLGNLVISHLPFVTSFNQALINAQSNVVSNTDMLVINMPSFSFYGGQTEQTTYINVRQAYEPYRSQIRTGLTYIVYSLGIVYIIKYIVGWGQTQVKSELKESSNPSRK